MQNHMQVKKIGPSGGGGPYELGNRRMLTSRGEAKQMGRKLGPLDCGGRPKVSHTRRWDSRCLETSPCGLFLTEQQYDKSHEGEPGKEDNDLGGETQRFSALGFLQHELPRYIIY